jgi:hypothetical protein
VWQTLPTISVLLSHDTHVPSGELHIIAAKDPEQEHPFAHDARGESLRLKYPVSADKSELPTPPVIQAAD